MAYSRRTRRSPARRPSRSTGRANYSRQRRPAKRSVRGRRSTSAGSRTVRIVIEQASPNAVARPTIGAPVETTTRKAKF
jgi:hypothetical protein